MLLASFLGSAQDCSPDSLEYDQKVMEAGEFKGQALQLKLESLIKELKILTTANYEDVQRNTMKHCLAMKEKLFQGLMVRAEPGIQENVSFQETISDFYKLHNDSHSALIYLDRALKTSPQSLPLIVKSFQLFSDFENVQLKDLAGKPLAIAENAEVLQEISRRAEKVAMHPDSNKALVIDAITHQAWVAHILKNSPQEMQYWEKILTLDPKHLQAHQSRLEYFISTGQVPMAIESMKKMLRENLATQINWKGFLNLLFTSGKCEAFVNWYKKAPMEFVANSSGLQHQLARCYIELGQKSEAEEIMKEVDRTKGKVSPKRP